MYFILCQSPELVIRHSTTGLALYRSEAFRWASDVAVSINPISIPTRDGAVRTHRALLRKKNPIRPVAVWRVCRAWRIFRPCQREPDGRLCEDGPRCGGDAHRAGHDGLCRREAFRLQLCRF